MPGTSEPRLKVQPLRTCFGLVTQLTLRFRPLQSYRLQLQFKPDNGGTMPSKKAPFTPSSILFRPHQNQVIQALVEAPGTAPGSEWFISMSVYRHICLATAFSI